MWEIDTFALGWNPDCLHSNKKEDGKVWYWEPVRFSHIILVVSNCETNTINVWCVSIQAPFPISHENMKAELGWHIDSSRDTKDCQ